MNCTADIIEVVELCEGDWSLGIAPASGAIVWCAYDQSEILRRTRLQSERVRSPFQFSCFPLAPYSNRIRHGRFDFGGQSISLAPNAKGHAHPLHGEAWLGRSKLTSCTNASVELEFVHDGKTGWPWAFSLLQDIVLDQDSLIVRMTLRNEADTAMPAGLGLHPYFSAPEKARLQFEAEGVWLADSENLPRAWRAATDEFSFASARPLKGVALDHCFTSWRGPARIEWEDRPYGIEITADPALNFAVVYVSPEENCFCFEPVSQMNDAVNWMRQRADTGIHMLAPQEIWSVEARLRVVEKSK